MTAGVIKVLDESPRSPTTPQDLPPACMSWKEYFIASIGYFGMGGGQSPITNFMPLLLVSHGFSPTAVGYANAFSNINQMIVTFGMAYVADRYKMPKTIVVAGSIGASFALWVMTVLSGTVTVTWIGVLIFCPFFSPVNSLYDRRVLTMLGSERKALWGSARMVLSVMWGLGSLAASYAVVSYGWWILALFFSVGYLMVAVCMLLLPIPPSAAAAAIPDNAKNKEVVVVAPLRISDVVRTIARSQRLQAYTVSMICTGMCLGVIWGFLLIYMQELQAATWLIGSSALGMVSTEILVFAFSRKLLEHLSADQLLSLGLFSMALRMAGYGLMPAPIWTVALNPLHGVSFACAWLAAMQVFSTDFPPEQSNSALGVLNAVSWGVGPLIANTITGNAYNYFGARLIFCGWGVLALTVGIWFTRVVDPWRLRGAANVVCRSSIVVMEPSKSITMCGEPSPAESPRHVAVADELP